MKLHTLYHKLALALMLLLIGIGLLYILLSLTLSQHYQQKLLQNLNRDLAQNLIDDRQLIRQGILNQSALKQTFDHYMTVNPSIEIYLLDQAGQILSYSADPGKVKRKHVDLQAIQHYLAGGEFPLLGDDPRSHDRQKIFSAAAIPFPDGNSGYLYIVLRGEEYDRAEQFLAHSFLFKLSVSALLISLLLGLVGGLYIFRRLTRRLQRLSSLMNNFRDSQFSLLLPYQAHRHGADEIDQLGENYNRMAQRICNQLNELKLQDEKRRELIANVSHDLRTPLATLRGYLETLQLKAPNLNSEQRRDYLNTALQHSERLSRLVEELFELAKLDAQEISPQIEPFALDELAQDVMQKFQLQAEQLQVALQLHSEHNLPLVHGDIGLIERVVENLLVNALRHTPAGGVIKITLEQCGNSVKLHIKDSGCGIPAQDLPHIFERFYQANNKHRSGDHTGLGLAITRQIIALHHSQIHVESQLDQGTEFFFQLPRVAQVKGL